MRHDSRSLLFKAPEADPATLSSIRHRSAIPTLDQGRLGSCTGNASTKVLSYAPFWRAAPASESGAAGLAPEEVLTQDPVADEEYAVGVYSDATLIDPFAGYYKPGDPKSQDTGSDGLSVAKVLKGRGLIAGYTHVTSLNAALTALARQAFITGTVWKDDMFDPSTSGEIKPTGSDAGGHEYVIDELDVERKRVWLQNSWTDGWGVEGRAWMSWDAYATLLDDDGDATVFVPNAEPAPEPTPVPVPSAFEAFAGVGDWWVSKPHSSKDNRKMVSAYRAWRAAGAPGAPEGTGV